MLVVLNFARVTHSAQFSYVYISYIQSHTNRHSSAPDRWLFENKLYREFTEFGESGANTTKFVVKRTKQSVSLNYDFVGVYFSFLSIYLLFYTPVTHPWKVVTPGGYSPI